MTRTLSRKLRSISSTLSAMVLTKTLPMEDSTASEAILLVSVTAAAAVRFAAAAAGARRPFAFATACCACFRAVFLAACAACLTACLMYSHFCLRATVLSTLRLIFVAETCAMMAADALLTKPMAQVSATKISQIGRAHV